MTYRTIAASLALTAIAMPGGAFAHAGHVAEAAGHAHWIALGAALVAGAIAAALAASRKPADDERETEAEPEGDAA